MLTRLDLQCYGKTGRQPVAGCHRVQQQLVAATAEDEAEQELLAKADYSLRLDSLDN